MKKILYILSLLMAFSAVSCTDLYEFDSETETDASEVKYTLSDFSATTYPKTSNTWTITDSYANDAYAFQGLADALGSAYKEGRYIDLIFLNLTDVPSNYVNSGTGALTNCEAIATLSMPVAETIGRFAFNYCSNMTVAVMPNVTSIEEGAFEHCFSLQQLTIGEITTLTQSSFVGCNSLYTISTPEVTTIEQYALSACESITTLSLPKVTSISGYAFNLCRGLTTLSLSTYADTKLTYIDATAFTVVDTSEITLTIGSTNSAYIDQSKNTLTLNGLVLSFKKIIIVDNE